MEPFGGVATDRTGEMPAYGSTSLHALQAEALGPQSGVEHPLFRSVQRLPGDMSVTGGGTCITCSSGGLNRHQEMN